VKHLAVHKNINWQGQELELKIESVAHGGIFVARHEGRVIFVSHTAPGETVRAKVFEDKGGSFCRAVATEILEPSIHRVKHFWKEAEKFAAGGAEFGHLALEYQRQLKQEVLTDALSRMAGLEISPEVQVVPGDDEVQGLSYRTRIQLQVSPEGVAGPYKERTHEVVPVKSLPLAVEEINELGLHLKNWQNVKRIEIAASSTGGIQYSIDKKIKGDAKLTEQALGRSYRISKGGFWQVHRGSAELLAGEVLSMVDGLDPFANNFDLYSGVGLFTGSLSTRYGKATKITSVESSKLATADAEANLVDLTANKAVASTVEGFLRYQIREGVDLTGATVILDPPRSGAGREVTESLIKLRPKQIIYVACDPVALARDLKFLKESYQVKDIRAFDLFPHTHHFESIASLVLS
jgi:tRNA/tmRNA/rRNA uracil-C5-methylase (TrmA/RlmC/RlmD family)